MKKSENVISKDNKRSIPHVFSYNIQEHKHKKGSKINALNIENINKLGN